MPDKIDQLYEALRKDGAVTKSRDNFRNYVLAPGDEGVQNRKALYEALKADGAVTSPTQDEFERRLEITSATSSPSAQTAPGNTTAPNAVTQQDAAANNSGKLGSDPKSSIFGKNINGGLLGGALGAVAGGGNNTFGGGMSGGGGAEYQWSYTPPQPEPGQVTQVQPQQPTTGQQDNTTPTKQSTTTTTQNTDDEDAKAFSEFVAAANKGGRDLARGVDQNGNHYSKEIKGNNITYYYDDKSVAQYVVDEDGNTKLKRYQYSNGDVDVHNDDGSVTKFETPHHYVFNPSGKVRMKSDAPFFIDPNLSKVWSRNMGSLPSYLDEYAGKSENELHNIINKLSEQSYMHDSNSAEYADLAARQNSAALQLVAKQCGFANLKEAEANQGKFDYERFKFFVATNYPCALTDKLLDGSIIYEPNFYEHYHNFNEHEATAQMKTDALNNKLQGGDYYVNLAMQDKEAMNTFYTLALGEALRTGESVDSVIKREWNKISMRINQTGEALVDGYLQDWIDATPKWLLYTGYALGNSITGGIGKNLVTDKAERHQLDMLFNKYQSTLSGGEKFGADMIGLVADLPLYILSSEGAGALIGPEALAASGAARVLHTSLTMTGVGLVGQGVQDWSAGEFSGIGQWIGTTASHAATGATMGAFGEAARGVMLRPTSKMAVLWNKGAEYAFETAGFTLPEWVSTVYSGITPEGDPITGDYFWHSAVHNLGVVIAMKGRRNFKNWKPVVNKTDLAQLQAAYPDLYNDVTHNLDMVTRGKGADELSDSAKRQLAQLQDDMNTPGKGVSWDTYKKTMNLFGYEVIPPKPSSVRRDGNVVQVLDSGGNVITEKKYANNKAATQERDKLHSQIEHDTERVNAQRYDAARREKLYYDTCAELADLMSAGNTTFAAAVGEDVPNRWSFEWRKRGEDGNFLVDENGNYIPDENYRCATPEDVDAALKEAYQTPEGERTDDQRGLIAFFEQTAKRMSDSVPTVRDLAQMVCDIYGISVDQLERASNLEPSSRRKGNKATQAMALFNDLLNRGVTTSRKPVGRVKLKHAETGDAFIEVYNEANPANKDGYYFYKDANGTTRWLAANEVESYEPIMNESEQRYKVSNDNAKATLDRIIDTYTKEASLYNDELLDMRINNLLEKYDLKLDEEGNILRKEGAKRGEADIDENGMRTDDADLLKLQTFLKVRQDRAAAKQGEDNMRNLRSERERAEAVAAWGQENGVTYDVDYLVEHPLELDGLVKKMESGETAELSSGQDAVTEDNIVASHGDMNAADAAQYKTAPIDETVTIEGSNNLPEPKTDKTESIEVGGRYEVSDDAGTHEVEVLRDNGNGSVEISVDGEQHTMGVEQLKQMLGIVEDTSQPELQAGTEQNGGEPSTAVERYRLADDIDENAISEAGFSDNDVRYVADYLNGDLNEVELLNALGINNTSILTDAQIKSWVDSIVDRASEFLTDKPVESDDVRVESDEVPADAGTTLTPTPQPEAADATKEVEATTEPMPLLDDGNPNYAGTTPERGRQYIYDESGLDKGEADAYVSANLASAEKDLDKIKKKPPKMGTNLVKYQKDKADWESRMQEAQSNVDYWNKVKASQADYEAEQAKARKAADAEVRAQAVVDEQARQAAELAKQQEQAQRGAGAVHPAIAEKWNNAPKIEGYKDEVVLANGERVPGTYYLVESGAVTPSHNASREFEKYEGFPVDENGNTINDRDYERDKDAQNITRSIADKYDSRALQTPVIVSKDGVVLSGNGRTMAGELAASNNTDSAYIEHLKNYGRKYGFSPEQVTSMKHPRAVFVPDADMPYTTETFAKFNAQEMKGQSKTEQAVKLGKVVDDATFNRIVREVAKHDSLSEFFGDDAAATGAINDLRRAGALNDMQYASMFDGDKLSKTGREIVENTLLGKIFSSDPDVVRTLSEHGDMRQRVIVALVELGDNVLLGKDYSLEAEIINAIKMVHKARLNGAKQGEPLSSTHVQGALSFDVENGQASDYSKAASFVLGNVLNGANTNDLKRAIALYNESAASHAHGELGLDLFGGGAAGIHLTKENILTDVIKILENGNKKERDKAVDAAIASRKERAGARADEAGPAAGSSAGSTGAERSGGSEKETPSLTHDEAISLIAEMEEHAEVAPEIELTIENWDAQFGEDGRVATPIGEVKMGENQFTKLMRQGREGKLGMIKPTLEMPDVIIEDASEAKNGDVAERKSSYVFVKAFKKADGSRYYYFTSITVSKDGKEVVVSSQEKSRNRLLRLMTEGKILWRTPKDATTASVEQQGLDYAQPSKTETATKGSGMTPQSIDMSPSVGKVSAKDSDLQAKGEKNAENQSSSALQAAIKAAEQQTETSPSDAQKEAGNYKKGHVKIDGFDISIEQPKGSVRSGVDASGKSWSQKMNNTYGYIRGTEGVDGDHIDVFLSDDPSQGDVFVVDQVNNDGSFDEHKVMYGFNSEDDARQAYLSNYEDGWQGLGAITAVSKDEFKKWIGSSHRKTKPFAEYKNVKVKGEQAGTMRQPTGQTVDGDIARFHKETDSSGRTAIDEANYNADDLVAPLLVDGKKSHIGITHIVPDDINEPTYTRAYYDYAHLIDPKTNKGWQAVGDKIDEWNASHKKDEQGFDDGDAPQVRFPSVAAALKFAEWFEALTSHQEQRGAGGVLPSAEEVALRDGLVEVLRGAGIEVVTDEAEGQRVLDAANGHVQAMGSRVNKRMAEIDALLKGREMNKLQQAVVDVFSGKKDNVPIDIERADGNRRVIMRQGNEQGAGTKHSVFGHYGTTRGVISADDILLVPEVLIKGERTEKQRGKSTIVEYRHTDENGTRFTVLTESKDKGEVFNDFYSNKKASNQIPQRPNGDTPESARSNDSDANLLAKLQKVADNASVEEEKSSEALFEATKEKFGTTNDLREAGYILPDGTMLDFSGRYMVDKGRDTSHLRGRRAVDHRAIHEVGYDQDDNETGFITDMADFIGRGAIRIDANAGTINLSKVPTAKQARVLRMLILRNDGDVSVDFGNGYDSEHYAEYESARATRVLGDIDRYFNEGIKPQGNISFFRTENGEAYGFVRDGKIYIDPRVASAETPVHEYCHLWGDALKEANPEAWERLKETMLGEKDVLDYVKKMYPGLEGDALVSEVFSHYSGRRGAERLRADMEREMKNAEGVFAKARVARVFDIIKRALSRFWEMARDLFAGKTRGLDKLTAEDFADMAMNDLLRGFDPRGEEYEPQARNTGGLAENFENVPGVIKDHDDYVSVKEVEDYLDSLPNAYNVHGVTKAHPINSLESLEALKPILDQELYGEIKKRIYDPNVYGCRDSETGMIFVFTHKIWTMNHAEHNWWHENTHGAYDALELADKEECGREAYEWLYKNDHMTQDQYEHYTISQRGSEGTARLIAYIFDTKGVNGILNGTFAGKFDNNEKIAKLATAIQNYYKYGETREEESRNRLRQTSSSSDGRDAENGIDASGRDRQGAIQSEKGSRAGEEVGSTQRGTSIIDEVNERSSSYRNSNGDVIKFESHAEQLSLFNGGDVAMTSQRTERATERAKRVKEMSDAELLKEMQRDIAEFEKLGRADWGIQTACTDEYDRRHVKEYNAECERVRTMLDENNVSIEEAEDMLCNAIYSWRDGYATADRSKLLAQFDTLNDYYAEKTDERDNADLYQERESEQAISEADARNTETPTQQEVAPTTQQTEPAKPKKAAFDPSAIKLRKLKSGETCYVERRYQESGGFDFTGSEVVKSDEDLAYIFRNLENSAIENTFLVLIKDGKATILHTGMGSYSAAVGHTGAGMLAASQLKPQNVIMVHNHPSGSLVPSMQDVELQKRVKRMFGENVVREAIIIDITSGQYSVFDTDNTRGTIKQRPTSAENEVDYKTYSFSKYVFNKDYKPGTTMQITDANKAAAFISSHRLGERDKMSLLVMNRAKHITGNVFLPWTNLDDVDIVKAANKIATYIHQMGGESGIIYGSGTIDSSKLGPLSREIEKHEVRLDDFINVEGVSAQVQGVLEDEVKYEAVPRNTEQHPTEVAEDGVGYGEADDSGISDEELAGYDAGRYSVAEHLTIAKMRLAERNRNDNLLRVQAMRLFGDNLKNIRKVMAAQKKYDKKTVENIVRLTRVVMGTGFFKDMSAYEVKRLLAAIKKGVGAEDLTPIANNVVDMLVQHQLRESKNMLHKLMQVRGRKVDARGVEVQAGLDIDGQRMMSALKDGMSLGENGLLTRINDCENRLGSEDEVIRKNAMSEYQGLMLAKEYHDNILSGEEEEIVLRNEKRQEQEKIYDFRREPVLDDDGNAIINQDGSVRTVERKTLKPQFKNNVTDENKQLRRNTEAAIERIEQSIRESRMERVTSYIDFMSDVAGDVRASRERAAEWRAEQQQRVDEIHHNANSDLQGIDPKSQTKEKKFVPIFNPKNDLVRGLFMPLATFEKFMRFFGRRFHNGEGYLFDRYVRGMIDCSDKEWRSKRAAHDELDAKVTELFGKTKLGAKRHWSDLFELERKKKYPTIPVEYWDNGERVRESLSQGEALSLYVWSKQKDAEAGLRRMGISEEDMETLKGQLDPKFVELADWVVSDFLPKRREYYNEVYERMFGAPMAAIENYFPIVRNSRDVEKPTDVAERDMSTANASTITGSFIKRVRTAAALDIHTDFFSHLLKHLDDMEHIAAWAEFNRDLNTLRNYKRFKNRVSNMNSFEFGAGKDLWKAFDNCCAIVAGVYEGNAKSKLDKITLNINKGFTGGAIAFRFNTALKQLLSLPAFWSDASVDQLLLYQTTPIGNFIAWKWAMKNLPGFSKRWQSRQVGDTRLMDTDMDWKLWRNKYMKYINRGGMLANAFVDAVTVASGAKAVYETRKRRYKSIGYTDEQAERKALQDAAISYNGSQQSSESGFVSEMQVDRTFLNNMLTIFRNSPFSYGRKMTTALREFKKRLRPGYKSDFIEAEAKKMEREGIPEDKAKKAARRLYRFGGLHALFDTFNYGYLLSFLWTVLGGNAWYLLFGEDDEKKEEIIKDGTRRTWFAPLEGFTGGNTFADKGSLLWKYASDEDGAEKALQDFVNWSWFTTPMEGEYDNLMRDIRFDASRAWWDVLSLAVQCNLGFKPETFTDGLAAIADYCDGDPQTTKEALLCWMRVIQVPQSQVDKIYFDELGLTARDAQMLNAMSMADRYSRYKMRKNNPLSYIMHSETDEKVFEKYRKRFLDDMKERMGSMDDEQLGWNFVNPNDSERRKAAAKVYNKRNDVNIQSSSWATPGNNWKPETKRSHQRYQRYQTWEDLAEDTQLNMLLSQAKNRGDEALYKALSKAKAELTDIKRGKHTKTIDINGLGDGSADDDKAIMEELRARRKEILQEYGIIQ